MGDCSLINKAVFLDRDGVINRAFIRDNFPFPPSSIDELEILPYVKESLRLLKENGFLLIIVTNQPDVGRGKQKKENVNEINRYLIEQLPLDDIFVCWHGRDNECDCRKPKPGMLHRASEKYGIDFKKSFLIGDRWRDINVGYAVGCKTIFIDYKYAETLDNQPDFATKSIKDATEWILRNL